MTAQSEIEELIAKMALGDRDAFAALYDRTSGKLFGVALRVLGTQAEAEDAVQDAYLKIWRNAGRYQVNGLSPMTWLITITRNLCIDRLRARRSSGGMDEVAALPDATPGPEAQAVAAGERDRVVACLETLEPQKSDAVRRAYLQGETYKELATRYDIPLNTIRTWLRRSLLKLRECLSA